MFLRRPGYVFAGLFVASVFGFHFFMRPEPPFVRTSRNSGGGLGELPLSRRARNYRSTARVNVSRPFRLCNRSELFGHGLCSADIHCSVSRTSGDCKKLLCEGCSLQYNNRVVSKFENGIRVGFRFAGKDLCSVVRKLLEPSNSTSSLENVLRCSLCRISDLDERDVDSKVVLNSRCLHKLPKASETKQRNTRPDVHVFYFRFLSRKEFGGLFPRTEMELEKARSHGMVDFFNFTKHQSVSVNGFDNLRQLLCGEGKETGRADLCRSSLADEAPYRFYLFDHTCRSKKSEGKLQSLIAALKMGKSSGGQEPVGNPPVKIDLPLDVKKRICGENNIRDFRYRVNDNGTDLFDYDSVFYANDKSAKVLSLSLIRTVDFCCSSRSHYVDTNLAAFVKKKLVAANSVIFLISDVGHGFTSSGWNNPEISQVSNPFLYIAIPKQFQLQLGRRRMEDLLRNQDRSFTLRDVHDSLKYVLSGETKRDDHSSKGFRKLRNESLGLFELSRDRSCKEAKVLQPNLCLDPNQPVSFRNDSIQVGLAEFGLGRMNDMVEDEMAQRENSTDLFTHSPFGPCAKLRGKTFTAVRKWIEGGTVRTSMDVEIVSEKEQQDGEVFSLVLVTDDSAVHPGARLSSYRRLFRARAKPRPCYRGNLDLDLCVCAVRRKRGSAAWRSSLLKASFSRAFGVPTEVRDVNAECLLLLARNYENSVSFESVNACDDRRYSLRFSANMVNMASLVPLPATVHLKPFQTRFLTSIIQTSYFTKGTVFQYFTQFNVTFI